MSLCFYRASLHVVAEIPSQGVVWTCGLHRKRLTDLLLTWTAGQREEGRRDVVRKGVWTEGNMEEKGARDRHKVANKKTEVGRFETKGE